MLPLEQFLTPEECYLVDTALLSSKDKFATRLAIYGLRCLQEISQKTGLSMANISHEKVSEWIQQEPTIQKQLQMDESFELFFSNLVISAQRTLKQISESKGILIQDLDVKQVIEWFEKKAKEGLN